MSLYLGTTPIASAMPSYSDIIDTLFPVGSCYIGTGSTCPLAAIKGTWTLKTSAVVTSVNTNVPIKGTGQGILVTNNNSEYRNLTTSGGQGICMGSNNRTSNVKIGTYDQANTSYNSDKVIGLTTDASKSGIVGTVTRGALSVNIWQRTA